MFFVSQKLYKSFAFLLIVFSSCVQSWNREIKDSNENTDLSDLTEMDNNCNPPFILCNGFCVDISRNHENCGMCGNQCMAIQVCDSGRCQMECSPGKTPCNGSCTDTASDIDNCGNCGNVCRAGTNAYPVCVSGSCSIECQHGWSDLDRDGSCESQCDPSSIDTCNGWDDNCNGICDENYECCRGDSMPCITSCGSAGVKVCTNDCIWSLCVPPEEDCNGIDDDCDLNCDNGFECCEGVTEQCITTCGSEGSKTCSSLCLWTPCQPPVESCNGTDDNCNGLPDDVSGCRITIYRFLCTTPEVNHYYKLDNTTPNGCTYEQIAWYNYARNVSGRSFSTTPMYSMIYSGSGIYDQILTISELEKNELIANGWQFEGIIGHCSETPVSGMTLPVYKLYKSSVHDHFYTISEEEKNSAMSTYGYSYEGIVCYAWNGPI